MFRNLSNSSQKCPLKKSSDSTENVYAIPIFDLIRQFVPKKKKKKKKREKKKISLKNKLLYQQKIQMVNRLIFLKSALIVSFQFEEKYLKKNVYYN